MMRTIPSRSSSRIAAALALLALAACAGGTEPEPGGEYLGELDSPFSIEGAAVIELHSPDLRSVTSPGRILAARGMTEETLRILVINPPQNQTGGPISFRVRMAEGAVPPTATVIAVSGARNERRDFVGGYAVRFTRLPQGAAGAPPVPRTGAVGPITFDRLTAPFFPGGLPLHPEEARVADATGNSNQIYDLGDARGYLRQYPGTVPPEFSWSR
ncbi:MAG TPA: hypothetical protein VFR37_11225 [Longimicrobium sp.]|nr:hypothetical protein [Longimicrobium sp.]